MLVHAKQRGKREYSPTITNMHTLWSRYGDGPLKSIKTSKVRLQEINCPHVKQMFHEFAERQMF